MNLHRCGACGRVLLTAPRFCPCGGQDFQPLAASGRGRVYSCTTLYAAAEAHEKDLPFQIAILELAEGARLTTRITGPPVAIGDAVTLAGERDGVYFFTLATH